MVEGPWDFLEPWRAALRTWMHPPQLTPSTYSFSVSLSTPQPPDVSQGSPWQRCVGVDIPVDQASFGERKKLREALELFTVLFRVNYNNFRRLLAQNLPKKASNCQLVWTLWPLGVLPEHNKAPLTWGDLLGFTEELWTNSPEFLSAMHKLEMTGRRRAAGMPDALIALQLSWTCVFPASKISGDQESGKVKDSLRLLSHQLREVMDFRIPPIAELCVKQSGKLVNDTRRRPSLEEDVSSVGKASTPSTSTLCQSLVAKNVDLAETRDLMEMVVALASTPCEKFTLSLPASVEDDSTSIANGGLLLNVLLRGRLLCYLAGNYRRYQIPSLIVKNCEVMCPCDAVVAPICSAVADLPPETVMECLSISADGRGHWLWLVYMLCCGSSLLNLHNLQLIGIPLAMADMNAISVVMKNRYPIVLPERSTVGTPVYGFASIPEGAELWPTSAVDNRVLISASAFRCRARYFPTTSPDWVEVIVPGYGICKTRVGNGASCFDHDSFELGTQIFRECRLQSLYLYFSEIEWDALVLELLRYVGGGLLTLSMQVARPNSFEDYDPHRSDLDLGELAAACPHLEVLELDGFDVVVLPSNDDALCDWPIKKVDVADSDKLPDLAPYLENPGMRMAQELVEIHVEIPVGVSARGNEDFDRKRKNLEGHDGDFLPLVKEKFPLKSKTGLLSVVASSCSPRRSVLEATAINKLDANMLSCIFAFAATPERRKVRYDG